MKKLTGLLLAILSMKAFANDLTQSVIDECTTNESIYFETKIRVNDSIGKDLKKDAVLRAVGYSTSNPDFVVKTFTGQWFYEYENEDAIFIGYKVRSHYLSVAVIYTPEGLSTIVCNSDNLKQKKWSIHRKAAPWKGTLDTAIRIEISNTSYGES